jgi:hypothetical protein
MKKHSIRLLAAVALLGAAACQDLEVTYQNLPDTRRVLATPDAIETVIRSSFAIWWRGLHNRADIYNYFPDAADETTRGIVLRGIYPGVEPRVRFPNGPEDATIWINRYVWDEFASGAANTNDALRVMQERNLRIRVADGDGLEIIDQTDRAYAWARLWQGMNLGYYALSFDRAPIVREDDPVIGTDPKEWEVPRLKPYGDGIKIAIQSLEQAIERIQTGTTWSTPPNFINGRIYNSSQVEKFAHTMIARLMIYNARTPAEREAVDWQKVLFHTARGLDFNFEIAAETGLITSAAIQRYGHVAVNNTATYRVDQHILGMADVSGAYQNWLATERDLRDAFLITSPDLRFQARGVAESARATTASNGAYFQWGTGTNIPAAAGQYNRSQYVYRRRTYEGWGLHNAGTIPIATADENRLYRAEALLRTGDLAGAAALINVTRTRGHRVGLNWTTTVATNLPPVTAAGVPQSADCVPRNRNGQCGSLLDALRYERAVELFGLDPMRAWFDYRGFGMLQEGQAYHLPIPGRYLPQMGIAIYEFGGVGGQGAAGPRVFP